MMPKRKVVKVIEIVNYKQAIPYWQDEEELLNELNIVEWKENKRR